MWCIARFRFLQITPAAKYTHRSLPSVVGLVSGLLNDFLACLAAPKHEHHAIYGSNVRFGPANPLSSLDASACPMHEVCIIRPPRFAPASWRPRCRLADSQVSIGQPTSVLLTVSERCGEGFPFQCGHRAIVECSSMSYEDPSHPLWL